jgi:hypothetical protein
MKLVKRLGEGSLGLQTVHTQDLSADMWQTCGKIEQLQFVTAVSLRLAGKTCLQTCADMRQNMHRCRERKIPREGRRELRIGPTLHNLDACRFEAALVGGAEFEVLEGCRELLVEPPLGDLLRDCTEPGKRGKGSLTSRYTCNEGREAKGV